MRSGDERTRLRNSLERTNLHIKYWSQIIGHFLNHKRVEHPLVIMYKLFFTNENMLEMMHHDTNANLYPMHIFKTNASYC